MTTPPPRAAMTPLECHHRRIRRLGLGMWALAALFSLSALVVAAAQLLLCAGPVDWPLTCRAGALLPALLALGLCLGLAGVLHEVLALGAEALPPTPHPPAPAWRSLASGPRRFRQGMGRLRPSHHGHVRNSVRLVCYALGLALTYRAFYAAWGDLEAGAWLILLASLLSGEALIHWLVRADR